jgi:hypothetical protein
VLHYSSVAWVRAALAAGVTVRLRTRGGSMWPTIASGDAVVVAGVEAGDLRPDEVALFERDDIIYAHRFVGRSTDESGRPMLSFSADAGARPDPLVPATALLGRVIRIEPRPASVALRHLAAGWSAALCGITASLRRLRAE